MQRINFYLQEYHPKPLTFDFRFATASIGLTLFALLIFAIIDQQKLTALKQVLENKQQQQQAISQQLTLLKQQINESQNSQQLDSEIFYYQNQLSQYNRALGAINLPQSSSQNYYSNILVDLAKPKSSSVWLTRIIIDDSNLSLFGTSTRASEIPRYVEELKTGINLRRQFDQLSIDRDLENESLVHFSLLNGRNINER
ncbi:hypothetical protein [Aliikangiella sp. G2MR2-5]|uniref:hypothetical protein n=1 Tax=Aliikangiella sp. G2MR2-5 TaxID=2788943 RepID=UPI0018ABA455|nr:hypothetical protein [Aliikangiella sp. G2MR2-5]